MIAPGALLIRRDGHFPERPARGMCPFSGRWSFLTDNSARQILDGQLVAPQGDSFHAVDSIQRAASGIDNREMIKAALERVLAGAGLRGCDCVEIAEVKMHSFRTIRYATVSGRARRLSGGNFPGRRLHPGYDESLNER